MPRREVAGSKGWIMMKEAPAFLNRPQRTVYKWVADQEVRTMRPLHERWLNLDDLRRMDAKTPRRRSRQRNAR